MQANASKDFIGFLADPQRAWSELTGAGPSALTVDHVGARSFYRWCQRWTATLSQLRRTFDGDLDQYLLLLTFVQGEIARSLAVLSPGARHELAPRGLNALSISEICSVPRETTRRKLGLLVKKGYLAVGQDGLFYLTDRYGLAQALLDLAPLYGEERGP